MNQSATRDVLLEHARKLFSQKGFRGTSIRLLTARAGVNLGAVTYHFGSKEALYHAVLEGIFEPLSATLARVEAAPGPPLERIDALVTLLLEELDRHPTHAGLIRHELALARPLPPPLRAWLGTIYGTLTRLIEAGQDDGSIVAGDSRLLALTVLAQPFYVAMARQALAQGAILPARGRAFPEHVHPHIRRAVRRSLDAERGIP
jgi:AcrR family transcriptional regulator